MNKGAKKLAIGTLIAGAIGYIAGILTAPKSGAETRNDIRSARDAGMANAEKQLKKLNKELNHLIDEATVKGKELAARLKDSDSRAELEDEIIDKAIRTRQKTREIISALRDGNADDKDLDKAVVEASKAIKAIKSYLKK